MRGSKPGLFDQLAASLTVGLKHGAPDVTHLPSDVIELNAKPYIQRHFLLGQQGRYHHILQSDGQHLHDHPWDFISVILQGSYIETTPDAETHHAAGSVLIRTAEQLHRLTLVTADVWTFVITSPPRRRWGFQTEHGWMHWQDYLHQTPTPSAW